MNKVLRLALVVSNSEGTWKKTVFYQIDPVTNTTGSYNTTLAALSADGINKAVSGMNKAETTDTFGTPSANNNIRKRYRSLSCDIWRRNKFYQR